MMSNHILCVTLIKKLPCNDFELMTFSLGRLFIFIYVRLKDHPIEWHKWWYKLKWKPIKSKPFTDPPIKGTWNIYISRGGASGLGFRTYNCDDNHGYGGSYKHKFFEVWLIFCEITFWIKWNIVVHKNGPIDTSTPHPLGEDKIKRYKERGGRWNQLVV